MGTSKGERQFRAVKDKKGTLMIESSLDGSIWEGAVGGLDAADVTKQFDNLHRHGKKIVNSPAYKYDKKK